MSGTNSKELPAPLSDGLVTTGPLKQTTTGKWQSGQIQLVEAAYSAKLNEADSPTSTKASDGLVLPPTRNGGGSASSGGGGVGSGPAGAPTHRLEVGASARSDSASSSWSAAIEGKAQSEIDTLNNKAKQDDAAIPSISEDWLPKGFVRCWTKGCGNVERSYKLMEHHVRCTDTNEFVQTCWRCVLMREDTVTNEMEARAFIVESSPDWAAKVKRKAEFIWHTANIQEIFPGLTRDGKRELRRQQLHEVFAPMMDQIARKVQHMELMNSQQERHQELINKVKASKYPEEAKLMLIELDVVFERDFLLAFANETPEVKDRYHLAATYSDEWVATKHTHFRMWFVCRGKTGDWVNIAEPGEEPLMGADQCRRIISSKYWDTLKEDPLAPGQRWMCSCATRYRWAFGVICEMKVRGVEGVQFTKAEPPSDHVQDMRAMFYEDNFKPTSPEDLYDKVPQVGPTLTADIIKPYNLEKMEYTISREHDQQLPVWEWNQMFNFCGITLPSAPLSKKEKKAANAKLWAEEAEKNAQAKAINDAAGKPKAARTGNW
jgi:hypothetical protein